MICASLLSARDARRACESVRRVRRALCARCRERDVHERAARTRRILSMRVRYMRCLLSLMFCHAILKIIADFAAAERC